MRKISICLSLLCLLLFTGCEDSNNITNNPKGIDGLSLLGLTNGRSFVYLQTDTVVTANPFTISVTDTTRVINISGAGDNWIISDGATKIINLKVGASSIIQNGYWKVVNNQDSLIYFSIPPLLMERSLAVNLNWEYYTPFYTPISTPTYFLFIYQTLDSKYQKHIPVSKQLLLLPENLTLIGLILNYTLLPLGINRLHISPSFMCRTLDS